jgi:hypothetical protein
LGNCQKIGGENTVAKPHQTAHPHLRARRTTNKPGTRKSGVARIVAGQRLNPDFAPPKQFDPAQTEHPANPDATELRVNA